jgi:hypothetical protein
VDSSQIGVLKQRHKISFGGLLQSHNSRRLETEVGLRAGKSSVKLVELRKRHRLNLEILGDFTDKPLEWKLPDKKFGRLLIPPNFTKSDGSRAEAMGLLHTASSLVDRCVSKWSQQRG